ncbi:MAG: hypothetical protein HY925_15175 [Elusimicrobia bacterium]|nr:hypothetical protein [Elusimicrobiota bacterium]
MTDNPFRSKGAATADAFCGREDTLAEMTRALKSGTSVALAASRRSGKSWMAQTILEHLKKDKFLTAYLDLVHVHSPIQWIERFAGAVLNSTASTPEELFATTRKFLPALDLSSVSADARGYRIRLPPDSGDEQLHAIADQVYRLPRHIAQETGRSIVLCLDEYPEILSFLEPKVIERWKARLNDTKSVVYLLSSSRPKLIEDILGDGLVKIFSLGAIPAEAWRDHVLKLFRKGGFTMDKETASAIVAATHGYSYYTQAVCAHLWSVRKSSRKVTEEDIREIPEWVLDQEDAYYEQIWRGLTKPRKSFLAAIAQEPEAQAFSKDFRAAHRLPSASTLQAVVEYLEDEGLISRNGSCRIVDPFFQEWLKRNVV